MRKLSTILTILTLSSFLTGCGFEIVDTGRRGLKVEFGKVTSEPLPEDIYFYNPFTTDVIEIDVRERKLEGETYAFTKDTQNVKLAYSLTYYPDPAKIKELYVQFGSAWEEKIVNQVVLGSMKDAIGQWIADDLVSKREVAKDSAEKEITEALATRSIMVTRLDFTNLDFDDAYEKAVEEKVVAVQNAAKAKNVTVQIMEEAKQKIETAKADAESMRIKSNALSQNKSLIGYEIATRWNGVLPQIMLGNGSMPMLDLSKLKSE
jgi:regulator of protease activity HflC (stomatin/prohibitin superfamily)